MVNRRCPTKVSTTLAVSIMALSKSDTTVRASLRQRRCECCDDCPPHGEQRWLVWPARVFFPPGMTEALMLEKRVSNHCHECMAVKSLLILLQKDFSHPDAPFLIQEINLSRTIISSGASVGFDSCARGGRNRLLQQYRPTEDVGSTSATCLTNCG